MVSINYHIFNFIITQLVLVIGDRDSHFILPKSGCEATVTVPSTNASDLNSFTNRCVSKPNGTDYRGRNIFLLGNSVIRHYSFTISSFLDGKHHDISLDREHEKQICGGIKKTNSCKHPTKNGDTCISFMWQNIVGYSSLYDDKRDICSKYSSTRACYKVIFNHAKNKDILIINSRIMDVELFKELGLSSKIRFSDIKATDIDAEIKLTNISYASDIIDIVLDFFPGTILWVNFPYIKSINNENYHDLNKGYDYFNTITSKAIDIKTSEKHRLKYMNVLPLQMENLNHYSDNIHHHGPLSQLIIDYIFQHIAIY